MARQSLSRKYLFYFAQENIEFRIPELKGVAATFNIDLDIPQSYDEQRPFLTLTLPSEECARKLISRTVSTRLLLELWAAETTLPDLSKALKRIPPDITAKYTQKSTSFRWVVDTFNKVVTHAEKIQIIQDVMKQGLEFEGRVDLTHPEHKFHLLLDYGTDKSSRNDEPQHIYFGRWLADGQRDKIKRYDLKKRKFIGNTSMEAGLSLLMANTGQVKPGSLVIDPFVGTGSLLVSCAHYGAYVMGTEIDVKLLHGIGKASRKGQKWRSRDENIQNSLRQYGLERHYVDVLAADSSRPVWRHVEQLFDAIITDPPYGVREATKKIEGEKGNTQNNAKTQYHISQVFTDLLNFAARYLVVGGRLVYWYPVFRPEYTPEHIPQHPCFTLVHNCEQTLMAKVSRRLLTMQKHRHSDDEAELNGAYIPVDPFKDETFRDKYFGPEVVAKERSSGQYSKETASQNSEEPGDTAPS